MPQSWALKRNYYSEFLCSAFSFWSIHAWYFLYWFFYEEDYGILDLLERTKRNSQDGELDEGKESGIKLKFDCVKSFMNTDAFQKFSTKYDLTLR